MTEYITTKEAAQLSGYTMAHIASLVRTQKIVGHRFGRSWMVSKRSLDDYMAQVSHETDGRYGPKAKDPFFLR